MNVKLFFHGGSRNHGCEAIVRCTVNLLACSMQLYSMNYKQDFFYELNKVVEINRDYAIKKYSIIHIMLYLFRVLKLYQIDWCDRYFLRKLLFTVQTEDICFSIGGDNYCYPEMLPRLIHMNRLLTKKGYKTVLWGCSIEPDFLTNTQLLEDLKRYELIVCRESITYEAIGKWIEPQKLVLYPDPAFTLSPGNVPALKGEVVGINVSPLIMRYSEESHMVLKNYERLIEYILKTTDARIALIPHVVMKNNDDREPLTYLYKLFSKSGRVWQVNDCNCMELKGTISQCKMFIGARTHATIAAYSTCVPTLVVGYSVKSKGIAKDIFGTDENYVIPVQSLRHEDDLTKAFQWLMGHEDEIRTHLKTFMPSYISKAWEAGEKIKELFDTGEK